MEVSNSQGGSKGNNLQSGTVSRPERILGLVIKESLRTALFEDMLRKLSIMMLRKKCQALKDGKEPIASVMFGVCHAHPE